MTDETSKRGTAPLANVRLFLELLERLRGASEHLDRYGCFYGESGLGKTTAATHAVLKTGAIYLECGSTWSTGKLVDSLCHELAMGPIKGPLSTKVEEIIKLLADDPRPLIFDEADHLVKKSLIDLVREIGDKSRAPVIYIGERHLPEKLAHFERAHNRILEWVESQPCGLKDAKELLKLYGGAIEIADDLLRKIVNDTQGSSRRIVSNIDRIRNFAQTRGMMLIDLATFTRELQIYTGTPFRRKREVAA